MAEESTKEKRQDVANDRGAEKNDSETLKGGIIARFLNWFSRSDDFEKRLKSIHNEETSITSRMMRRSQRWQRTKRQIIVFSIILEVIAVAYAVLMTRTSHLDWKIRSFRVLPMFLLPFLSSLAYYALLSFFKIWENKDRKTLERLKSELQAKLDELKQKTNYYTTQELIQRYDTDPAAKAAAATVLASKLGAESGLKVRIGDDPTFDPHPPPLEPKPDTAEGIRNRKRPNAAQLTPEEPSSPPSAVEHYRTNPGDERIHDGGWLAWLAAALVGESPMQSYALICGNCHRHNGLISREDFLHATYYCPHCHVLNAPKSDPPDQSLPTVATSLPVTDSANDAD